MWEWIERLQSMPETARRRAALLIAAFLTLLIILAWVLVELMTAPSFTPPDPPPYAQEDSFKSLREDVERLKEAGQDQAETWRTMMEAFKSMPSQE